MSLIIFIFYHFHILCIPAYYVHPVHSCIFKFSINTQTFTVYSLSCYLSLHNFCFLMLSTILLHSLKGWRIAIIENYAASSRALSNS